MTCLPGQPPTADRRGGDPAAGRWIQRYDARPQARARLFCFAHAGGGASAFRPWSRALPADLEVCPVQLPGRETRFGERPPASIEEVVGSLVPVIRALADRPFAFFGNSMGAVVAFETARALADARSPMPHHVFVSARRAPAVPDPEPPLAGLDDAAFVAEIDRRYGGIPAEVAAHDDLLALLLPSLRADIAILESFEPPRGRPLDVPLTAFGGVDDHTTTHAALERWGDETTGPVRVRMFPGGHFFVGEQQAAVLDDVMITLRSMLAGGEGAP